MFKVIIVSPRPPWCGGGVERVVGEVARRLQKDLDISIYSTDDHPGVYYWQGLKVNVFRRYSEAYRFSLALFRCLKREKFDLIHSHSFPTFMPLAASQTIGGKKVFNPHFHYIGSTLKYRCLRKIYEPLIGSYLFEKADLIVCFSNTEKNLILQRFNVPHGKIKVIYNGIDVDVIRNSMPYDFDGKLILYVGRLERYKNVQMVIKAMPYLPNEYRFYVIGSGPYEANLKRLVHQLGLSSRVYFLGFVTDEEMYRWLNTCSVLVQLSEIESGLSIACLEALAAGKPIIVNDDFLALRETLELFGGKAVLPLKVTKSAVNELAKLVEDSTQLRARVSLHDFHWDTTAERVKNVYLNLLEGNSESTRRHDCKPSSLAPFQDS